MQLIEFIRKLKKNTPYLLIKDNELIENDIESFSTCEIHHITFNSYNTLYIYIDDPICSEENAGSYISLNDIKKIIQPDIYIFVASKYLLDMNCTIHKIIVNSDCYLEIY